MKAEMAPRRVLSVLMALTMAVLCGPPVGARPMARSTGAAAATGATGVAAAAPLPLPTTELASASIGTDGGGRTDLFTRSSDGHLIYQYELSGAGAWRRPLDLGGRLRSQPASASWARGRIDVFARGTDDSLHHRWSTNGRWSAWESLGGVLTSAPAVASWAPGRLDVFVRGADNALYHRLFQAGRGWSAWERLGGVLTSSPTVDAWSPRRLDVFARGGENAIYQKSFDGTAWRGWERLSGTMVATSQPAVAAPTSGRLDVFVRGTDRAMWMKSYGPGGWTSWTSLRGIFASGPGTVASDGHRVRVVGRSPDGYIYLAVRSGLGDAWTRWGRIAIDHIFRNLATWVDVSDYATLDPATAVPDMRARGVRALYLETARFDGTSDLFDAAEAGQWLDLAHQHHMDVVGWYRPAYGDMARDLRRTLAVARFVSPGGQRFDAVGIEIESLDEVSLAQFNQLSVQHLVQVRAQTPVPLAAIVPSPDTTEPGERWAGFPWARIAADVDAVVPQVFWSLQSTFTGRPLNPREVFEYVGDQKVQAGLLTGTRPLVVMGGIDEPGIDEPTPVTADGVGAFVDTVAGAVAIGGGHYDYATTPPDLWTHLARLNTP